VSIYKTKNGLENYLENYIVKIIVLILQYSRSSITSKPVVQAGVPMTITKNEKEIGKSPF
jgi:hypothetical protein